MLETTSRSNEQSWILSGIGSSSYRQQLFSLDFGKLGRFSGMFSCEKKKKFNKFKLWQKSIENDRGAKKINSGQVQQIFKK